MATQLFDVAVVGAGIPGLVSALGFAANHCNVALIDPRLQACSPDGPIRARNYAITPAARSVLRHLGAESSLNVERITPFTSMHVWDAASSGVVHFNLPPMCDALGWIIEHDNLQAALLGCVSTLPRITMIEAGATHVGHAPAVVSLDSGMDIKARLVVGADGVNSLIRAAMGVNLSVKSFHQRALVCNVTTELPHNNVARQRFLPGGPLAFLPLPDPHQCSIVWSCADTRAAALLAEDTDQFSRSLAEDFDFALGAIREVGSRSAFVLEQYRAERLAFDGFALVGDAAHRIHPLAWWGLNLGILDGAALVESLGEPRSMDSDDLSWPSQRALAGYSRWRASEAAILTSVTAGLNRLFSAQSGWLRGIRGLGMNATDRAGPAKDWLIARAMGLQGDLPEMGQVDFPARTASSFSLPASPE